MAETRRLLAVFLLGLLVGVAATATVGLGFEQSMSVSVPSHSVESHCGESDERSGWFAQVPGPTYHTVVVNHSVAGPVANATLTRVEGERFRLSITTATEADGCRYQAAATLPDEFESLTVRHDGEHVRTVENGGDTTARFWSADGS